MSTFIFGNANLRFKTNTYKSAVAQISKVDRLFDGMAHFNIIWVIHDGLVSYIGRGIWSTWRKR
eukprot:TRINITY_DN4455_c0_g1_i1.p3 TRINITY_DN4455_c0_g1~~TRINITY_DN4455_c0_g1_i1.p3  ORF type:complete len:64 (-),score=11.08 TRINITY_DN4455_c0_g1_i1:217-408(-)